MDTWLKNFWAKLHTDLSDLWKNDKLFFILFGILVVVVKFHSFFMDLIIADSKSIYKSAQQSSAKLQTQEGTENTQAYKLVEQASDLAKQNQNQEVNDDWFKK